MNGTFWAAVSALVGVCGLAGALVMHMLRTAEDKGHTRARIEALERDQKITAETSRVLPKLEATLEALTKVVDRTDQTLNGIMQGTIQIPARGRRAQGS